MSKPYTTSGISEDLVENFNEVEELIKSLSCCICLEIVKNPYECENCESLYCYECWNMMKITGKNCVYDCKTPIIKAKKFIFNMLSKIRFRCQDCQKRNIPYQVYLSHLEICLLNNKNMNIEVANGLLAEAKAKVEKLNKELEAVKADKSHFNSINSANNEDNDLILLNREQIRNKFLTSVLNTAQKKELYNAVFEGSLDTFRNLVENKKFNIFEEVSAKTFYWTSFHYAMHYGQLNIIFYIMDHYKQNLNYIMRLESNDGRCPILCLLKSNALNSVAKKDLLLKIFAKYNFLISAEVIREFKNRDMDSLIEKYKLVSYN
jgi:hypothetical protein